LIYQRNKNTFVKISNNLHYSLVINQIPTKQDDIFGTGSLLFNANPKIPTPNELTVVSLLVIGTICDNHGTPTIEKVGAYLDVEFHP
jgi:hypothetical protein